MSQFIPQDTLEKLVSMNDSEGVIKAVANGVRLTRMDVFRTDDYLSLTNEARLVLPIIGAPIGQKVSIRISPDKVLNFDEANEPFFNESLPNEAETRLLKEIKNFDENSIVTLSKDFGKCICNIVPNGYIPYIAVLSKETQKVLFQQGFDTVALILLLRNLLSRDDNGAIVPLEVEQLSDALRKDTIHEIVAVLTHEEDDVEDDDIDDVEDDDAEDDDAEDDDDADAEDDDDAEEYLAAEYKYPIEVDAGGKVCQPAIEFIQDFLGMMGIDYKFDDEINDFSYILPGSESCQSIYMSVYVRRCFVLMYAVLPFKCPKEQRQKVAEFLMRVNHNLAHANWELDMIDGRIRVKQCYPTVNFESSSLFNSSSLSTTPAKMVEVFVPYILDVMEHGMEPKLAYKRVNYGE